MKPKSISFILFALLLTACGAPAPQVTVTREATATSQPTAIVTVTATPTASVTPTPAVPAEFVLSTIEGIEGFAVFNPDKTATVTIGGEKFENVHLDGVVKQIDAETMQVMGWYARLNKDSGKWTIDIEDVIKVLAPRPGADGKLQENPEEVLPNFDPRDMQMVMKYYVDGGVAPQDPFTDGKMFGLSKKEFDRLRFDQIKLRAGNGPNGDGSRVWQNGHKGVSFLNADGGGITGRSKAFPMWVELDAPAIWLEGLGVGWTMTTWDQSGQVLRSTVVMRGDMYPLWSTKLELRDKFMVSLVATGNGTEAEKFLEENNAVVLEAAQDNRLKTLTVLPAGAMQELIWVYEFDRNASSFE